MNDEKSIQGIENDQEQSLSLYGSFSNQFVHTMQEISKLADKRASTLLLSLGTAIVILAMAMKLQLFGRTMGALQPSEFISVIILSGVLLAGGSYLRVYQIAISNKLGKDANDKILSFAEKAIQSAKPKEQDDL